MFNRTILGLFKYLREYLEVNKLDKFKFGNIFTVKLSKDGIYEVKLSDRNEFIIDEAIYNYHIADVENTTLKKIKAV